MQATAAAGCHAVLVNNLRAASEPAASARRSSRAGRAFLWARRLLVRFQQEPPLMY